MWGFIRSREAYAFAWGSHDCAIFAADCVVAMSLDAVDYATAYRGKYDDATSAANLVPDLRPVVTDILGEPLDNILFAQRGDVVWFPGRVMGALGIVVDSLAAVASEIGVGYLDAHRAGMAWRV